MLPDKPSIAVLPFLNASSDPEQDYFADGMTEDIITELSRFDDLFVIARNSSFAFKNRQTDVRTIARELGVGFVLQGSIRKAGQQVRITAQLISADGRTQIWAERYDGAVEDVFELQDRVTRQVVGAIFPQISQALLSRIDRGEEEFDEAHELAWRAQATSRSALREHDEPRLDLAMSMANEAIDMNSKCGVAYQVLCYGYSVKSLYRWGDNPGEAAKTAEAWAEKFLLNVPGSYRAHYYVGLARIRLGKYAQALIDFQYAHEQNSSVFRGENRVYVKSEHMDMLLDGLRKAGFP